MRYSNTARESAGATERLVALRGITKTFPNVIANDHVDLDVYSGQVHALLGENGAGKSTLVKILYGFYRADSGQILLDGKPVSIRSPHDARNMRIGMVFQEFTLIPAFSVAENIALFLPDLKAVLNTREIDQRIKALSQRYGLHVDPRAMVSHLTIGEQQKVEILKLLLSDARLLILDEPTRVLAPHEVDALFSVLDRLREDGYAIILITHKMKEVLACADRITVLRNGRVAGSLLRDEADENGLVELMFAKKIATLQVTHELDRDKAAMPMLELRAAGTRGVVFIPENPLAMATVPYMMVLENFSLTNTWRYARHAGLTMDWHSARADAESTLAKLGFELPLYAPAKSLSGGNLQRMVIIREMCHQPRLIVASYLTRGLDVQSTLAARRALLQARDNGAGVLLVSEDLEELFSLSDRLIVLYQGKIAGTFMPTETNVYEIGHLMTGAEVPYAPQG